MRRLLALGSLLLAACQAPDPAEPVASPAPSAELTESQVPSPSAAPEATPPPASEATPAGMALPDPLQAVGTEPFWAATLAGERLTYMTPDDPAGTTAQVHRYGSSQDEVVTGQLAGAALRLRITAGPCSDGMSDTVYPYTAALTIGGEVRQGCARPANQPSAPLRRADGEPDKVRP